MRKMATVKRSPWREAFEDIVCTVAAFMLAITLFVGFLYLPEFFEARDGKHEGRTIYGLRG